MNNLASNQTLPDRLKLPLEFDSKKLQLELDAINASEWIPHFIKHHYQGSWTVIPLRCPEDAHFPLLKILSNPECKDYKDTTVLKHCPYFQQVLSSFPFNLYSVRLMKLNPGSKILEHQDCDMSLEKGVIRLHIPIQTNNDLNFRLNKDQVVMNEGECWYLRLTDPHSVENNGLTARVHLVIDAPVDDLVLNFFESLGAFQLS